MVGSNFVASKNARKDTVAPCYCPSKQLAEGTIFQKLHFIPKVCHTNIADIGDAIWSMSTKQLVGGKRVLPRKVLETFCK